MEIKILQVFYDKNGLPYKDKERTVHYPITSGTFLGASNTTQIRFYYDQLDELNESTFVAISKLPNGKIGSEVLETKRDAQLEENYAVLNLSQFYTQYKGDVFISLQGYEGGVRVEQDENGIYSILGTPTIQATGSIRMYVAYAPTFIGSDETENITLQRVLAELATKLGIRQETLHVEELPTVGNPNVWYVVNDDTNDPSKANIYIWNAKTQTYVWVGDNSITLSNYYTKEQGDSFEQNIDERVTSVENELESVASGSPEGVYANLSALETAYPTGTSGIFVVQDTGYWYFWNGSAWTYGGVYQATEVADGAITQAKLSQSLTNEKDNAENSLVEVMDNMPEDWEEETNYTDLNGHYYARDGTLYELSNAIACKCPVEFGKKYKISAWTNYDITWAIRLLKYDGSVVTLDDYSATQPIVDYEVTPTIDTQALLINHHTTSPSITIKKRNVAPAWGENDVKKYLDDNILYGTKEVKSGSYFQKWVYDFKASRQYRVKVLSSASANVQFYGLVDAEDTDHTTWQFQLKVGESILWTPEKNFEALYYAAVGDISVQIEFPDYYLEGNTRIFYCGSNRAIQTLKEGIEKATLYMNSILFVDDGVYDLIEEFGADYFAGLTSNSTMAGLLVENRIHIIFSSNSIVKCHYTGDNQYAMSLFSPFNSGPNGFILENLNLECSRVRYAVHDERSGKREECLTRYINCKFKLDNSNNPYWVNSCCIGGGLGSNHQVDIRNCVFDAPEGSRVSVSYHDSNNYADDDNSCSIVIENNYFVQGSIEIVMNRNDAIKDKYVLIHGNSVPPVAGADANGMCTENMTGNRIKYYCWGNIVRKGFDNNVENVSGTLRHLLAVIENIDFADTDYLDLGSLSWTYDSAQTFFYASIGLANIELPSSNNNKAKVLATKYKTISASGVIYTNADKTIGISQDGYVVVRDSSQTTADGLTFTLKGIIMAFKKASS